jgi:phosphatidate cytidylyltransferase
MNVCTASRIVVVFFVSSIFARTLTTHYHTAMSNLVTRVLVALVAIPLFVFLVLTGGLAFTVFVAVLSALGVREFCQLAETKGARPHALATMIPAFTLPLVVGYDALHGSSYAFAAAVLSCLVILSVELWRNIPNPLQNISASLSALAYVSALFSCLNLVRFMSLTPNTVLGATPDLTPDWQAYLLLGVCITVWSGDSAAYFVGMSMGRHKIFPRVSPKKSWEGSIAGFIISPVAFGVTMNLAVPAFPLVHAVVLGALIGIIGPIGDFAESLLKRDADIKDSSALIPGHGGVLDRFDSLLFAGPLVYVYLILVR